ncbi:hypothetical protein [Agromyces sp. NPDC049794]|uniref:hypothetical protein n=1 Tax=unclassified Agromyces TaxID=2639701 RepID=UPI00340D7736
MSTTPTRTDALRETLASIAHDSQFPQRRPWRAIAGACIAAFVVAGAVSGAAVATAIVAQTSGPSSGEVSAQTWGEQLVGTALQSFGEPIVYTGAGDTTIDLGEPPPGAEQLILATHCNSPGSFTFTFDDDDAGGATNSCADETDTQPGHGMYASAYQISADAPLRRLHVEAPDGASFSLWAAWTTSPEPVSPSAAQSTALEDGLVDENEYRLAFARFAGCMDAAGHPLVAVDDSGAIITYSTTAAAEADGSTRSCYLREFDQINTAWQISR